MCSAKTPSRIISKIFTIQLVPMKWQKAEYQAPSSWRRTKRLAVMWKSRKTKRKPPTRATRIFFVMEWIFGKFILFRKLLLIFNLLIFIPEIELLLILFKIKFPLL